MVRFIIWCIDLMLKIFDFGKLLYLNILKVVMLIYSMQESDPNSTDSVVRYSSSALLTVMLSLLELLKITGSIENKFSGHCWNELPLWSKW